MRECTKVPAGKQVVGLRVKDLRPGTIYKADGHGHGWHMRTDESDRPTVYLGKGTLLSGLELEVSEVLADGDSITIGPDE